MSFPLAPEHEFGPGDGPEELTETVQHACGRLTTGVKAVVDSFDVPVGLTPKELIWTLNKTKLYRYVPVKPAEERYPIPLLLVYALINKPFIFDLAPGRSFIEFMVQQGFDMYLLDWGAPGPEDQSTSFDDYVTEYLYRAVRKMLRTSGAQEISLLGYCLGATLTVVYAALFPDTPIRNIILLTAPLDFSRQSGDALAVWLKEGRLDIDTVVDSLGNVPGELIALWAKMLNPAQNFVGSYLTLWKMLDDPTMVHGWQAINRWIEDVVPLSGAAFRQFVQEYVRENQLARGEHRVQGKRVDLSNIHAPLLNIVAQYDHLVAQSQAESLTGMISSEDKEFRVIPSTHVGIMASRRARHKLWPEVVEWLGPRSG